MIVLYQREHVDEEMCQDAESLDLRKKVSHVTKKGIP